MQAKLNGSFLNLKVPTTYFCNGWTEMTSEILCPSMIIRMLMQPELCNTKHSINPKELQTRGLQDKVQDFSLFFAIFFLLFLEMNNEFRTASVMNC